MLLVDSESGSTRPHRPLFFDPPWEKMKGTERGIKAKKRGGTRTWEGNFKAVLVVFGKGQVVVGVISYVNSNRWAERAKQAVGWRWLKLLVC